MIIKHSVVICDECGCKGSSDSSLLSAIDEAKQNGFVLGDGDAALCRSCHDSIYNYHFTVTENTELGHGFFAYVIGGEAGGELAMRGAGETELEAIACLCAVMAQNNGEEVGWSTHV